MKKYNLFLDDFRSLADAHSYTFEILYATKKWEIVRSYDEFVKFIEENGLPEIISFDHDLADEHYDYQKEINYDQVEKTGYHCAKWLINYCLDHELNVPGKILIHSANTVGSKNIKSLFDTYWKVYNK